MTYAAKRGFSACFERLKKLLVVYKGRDYDVMESSDWFIVNIV